MFVENQIWNILLRKYHMCIALRILPMHGPEISLKKHFFLGLHTDRYMTVLLFYLPVSFMSFETVNF